MVPSHPGRGCPQCGTSQPWPSGTSPCSCLALRGDKRANTALSPAAWRWQHQAGPLGGVPATPAPCARGQGGLAAARRHGQSSPRHRSTRAVPTWDLPTAAAGRNISLLSGVWALLLTWQPASRGGCVPAKHGAPHHGTSLGRWHGTAPLHPGPHHAAGHGAGSSLLGTPVPQGAGLRPGFQPPLGWQWVAGRCQTPSTH